MSGHKFAAAGFTAVLGMTLACGHQAQPPTSPTGQSAPNTAAAADGSTLKATAPTPMAPVNDERVADLPTLTVGAAALKFSQGALQYRFEVFNDAGAKVQDSGVVSAPSFKVTTTLDFAKRHTWHARAEYQGAFGPWSAMASFVSPEGGYIRGNELFDPLSNNKTVGERVGATTFIAGKGIRLDDGSGYVRYLLPQTLTAGEFSAEVEGLRANAPGNKSKVFGMQEGQGDFITNKFRVDIQYRGASGSPANSMTFRALYGSASDLSLRYEPDTAVRYRSVYNLNPSTTYYWKTTWGNGEFRVTVREGGITGQILYNEAVPTPRGSYSPSPHYAYLGAPVGRSGDESVSIPGAIYRNVWISPRPRP
jgi:hypothetical protein